MVAGDYMVSCRMLMEPWRRKLLELRDLTIAGGKS